MRDEIEVIRTTTKGQDCLLAHASISSILERFSELKLSQIENDIAQLRISRQAKGEYLASRFLSKYLAAKLFGGQYTDWQITHTDQKTPQLENKQRHIFGAMSMSHTQDYVAVAMNSGNAAIGVDVEKVKTRKSPRDILANICRAHELSWYDADPSLLRFYQLWTAKEAIVKSQKLSIWQAMNPITELSFGETELDARCSNLNLSHFQSKNADTIGAWAFVQ